MFCHAGFSASCLTVFIFLFLEATTFCWGRTLSGTSGFSLSTMCVLGIELRLKEAPFTCWATSLPGFKFLAGFIPFPLNTRQQPARLQELKGKDQVLGWLPPQGSYGRCLTTFFTRKGRSGSVKNCMHWRGLLPCTLNLCKLWESVLLPDLWGLKGRVTYDEHCSLNLKCPRKTQVWKVWFSTQKCSWGVVRVGVEGGSDWILRVLTALKDSFICGFIV